MMETEKLLSQIQQAKMTYTDLESQGEPSEQQRKNYRQAMRNINKAVNQIAEEHLHSK